MKKYFCVSDVHGFFFELKKALHEAGFNKKNPEHILIVCGDIADRGPDNYMVYEFLKSLPRERRILIRGNHELLLRDAINRGFFYDVDLDNGTVGTIIEFSHHDFIDCVYDPQSVCEAFKKTEVLDWIFGPEWQNYAILGQYIFVHSWVPTNILEDINIFDVTVSTKIEYRPDWRDASQKDWEKAMWVSPIVMAKKELVPPGYTIVCGHFGASYFHDAFEKKTKYKNHNIYRGHGCIALDATTVRSGFVNVLVLTEEELHEPKGSK